MTKEIFIEKREMDNPIENVPSQDTLLFTVSSRWTIGQFPSTTMDEFLETLKSEFDIEDEELSTDETYEKIKEKGFNILPLFLFEHGNVSLDTFRRCKWDSSRIGIVVFKDIEKMENLLDEYSDYLNGETFKVAHLYSDGKYIESSFEYTSEDEAIAELTKKHNIKEYTLLEEDYPEEDCPEEVINETCGQSCN